MSNPTALSYLSDDLGEDLGDDFADDLGDDLGAIDRPMIQLPIEGKITPTKITDPTITTTKTTTTTVPTITWKQRLDPVSLRMAQLTQQPTVPPLIPWGNIQTATPVDTTNYTEMVGQPSVPPRIPTGQGSTTATGTATVTTSGIPKWMLYAGAAAMVWYFMKKR